jgi:predicted nucleic acid-binding protein
VSSQGPIDEPLLVFDTTVLNHFALADRLDILANMVIGRPCATTGVVLNELRSGAERHPALNSALELDWMQVIALDQPAEIRCFADWVRRIGAGARDMGEASVFAGADIHGGVAVTDDRDATRVGRAHGLSVHGTIWLLAGGCGTGKLTTTGAGAIIDALRQTGHRLPCTGTEFPAFARRCGLL